ncbi:phospholipid-transporting ATPase 1 [Clavulina sp. PMI_390]|nr:phospholipid-transporting ATPase 1 [Clavulina sp. PMI_390]
MIDPELRLRTVRTAASTIAEADRAETRRQLWRRRRQTTVSRKNTSGKSSFFRRNKETSGTTEADPRDKPTSTANGTPIPVGKRRDIHFNIPLPQSQLDSRGEPIVRYARNKVRTSKYTPITFLPKNLYEQFRRVANIFFLATVILSIFPMFGATTPQLSMVPLVFIISVTALKDGIEDYRRASLDDEVNTSAATKLGDWRNVNQPTDPRTTFQRLFGLGATPGKVTRGVRKLREREASSMNNYQLTREENSSHQRNQSEASVTTATNTPGDPSSGGDYSYPPMQEVGNQSVSSFLPNTSQYAMSTRSARSNGVVNYDRQTSGTAHWERTLWKKLEVGDCVLLTENDQVPADIVVLSTSDANGLCYVETKNLDGETNLKPRRALRATSSILSEEDLEHSSFILDAEPPHPNLYSFNGALKFRSAPSGVDPSSQSAAEKLEPVTINELLLRGCAVRNTKWIIGLVVFTGADTKIMLNGGDTPSKRSKIEKETNFNVMMNFFALAALCLIAGIANAFYYAQNNTSGDFFYEDAAAPSTISAINGIVTLASCLIAFQNIVPISLYISIEIVKTIQAYFISQDVDMYYEPLDAACVPKTWNISDDLGQIEYIFSDKTGTLTQNIMEFQRCSINGVSYGEGVTEAMRGAALRQGRSDMLSPEEQDEQLRRFKDEMLQTMHRAFKNRYEQPDALTLISPRFASDLTSRDSSQRAHIISFFRAISLCHTVIAEKNDPVERPFELEYKAESPDEAALAAVARDVGFPFLARSNSALEIEVMGQVERYAPLKVLEFNSTRKRMSIIVRSPEGRIILYTKGADSVIYARLAPNHDADLKASTSAHLETFANGGLRTLCVAYRMLDEHEYLEWSRAYDAAAASMQDREEEIEKACDLIENNFTLLGATALEDKLQVGVPETIEILHRAGIKLWILTGDKLQTAIEIGFSCNLLKPEMEMMILSANSPESARMQIEAGLNKIASMTAGPSSADPTRKRHLGGFAVVIDGETLRYALDPALKAMFLNLGTQCDTVVCCRVSPAQKALTVKLVKEGRNAMTLSIGDGANDVAMIQEANVGCGLLGLEGSQAAMSADYAFGQFRFLAKLLIVHGRWSYQRVSDMHANFFYKNVIWTLAMFWFGIYSNFDATYLYQVTFVLLYNVVFTSLPVIALGAFDQDLNARASLAFPQLYYRGVLGLEYTRWKFWMYMADGLYQSIIVFFIPYIVWTSDLAVAPDGRGIDSLSDFGTTVAIAAIFAANAFVGLSNRYWTVITWVVIVGSTLACPVWIAIYSQFDTSDYINEFTILFLSPYFWFAVFLSLAFSLAPRYLARAVTQIYHPLDKDIIREAWVAGNLKEQLGIRHRYRKNKNSFTENSALFSGPVAGTDHHDVESGDDYTPVRFTAGEQRPQAMSDGSLSPPPADRNLLDIQTDRRPPISPALSYYSASGIPVASATSDAFQPSQAPGSPPPNSSRPPSMPNAYVHENRSRPDGLDYEMRVRTSLPSLDSSGSPPPARAGLRDRQESWVGSSDRSPMRTPNPDSHRPSMEEDQGWSGAIAL